MRFSPIFNCFSLFKGYICFLNKIKIINNEGLFSELSLIIFTKGANNSDHNCTWVMWDRLSIASWIY